ncbi:rhamnose ABC transporter substrate-binding protein [Saliterribacillus persicus]|uniref:Monosaccharide ABC transporter substrate-binding protein (CUT2 family) n=1 Tax=Saliterribacillus persicus TaxID=930114 RepID=A0A368XRY4_9BACI|nr:rhamnose ABC transporter substrate-binding protein [Saliterribacillus persicus]RCW69808.1 monosaccharide ABC transporter substrate-binding protein (CUT2 family) [Saliterribacillus persicus]
MLRRWVLYVLLLFVFGILVACGDDSETSGDAAGEGTTEEGQEETDGEQNRYAIVFKNTGNPYGEKEMEGFENAINELGAEAILRAPDQPTVEGQIQIIEELIAQQVDAIAIVGNDYDGLQPVLTKAMNQDIKVLSLDSAVNGDSRMVHINQADPEAIGRTQIQAVAEIIDNEGQFAVLSATSQASNQNLWIEWMQTELEEGDYGDMELVEVAYGDDLRDKSVSETEALLQSYPDLKAIVSPTTVGIAAASKVITDKGLQGEVVVTGLGLPSEMAEYINNGVSPWMYLWNPLDVGYLAGYAADALVEGEISGEVGDTFEAGDLGSYEVTESEDGTEVLLGEPFRFDEDNIDEWKEIY